MAQRLNRVASGLLSLFQIKSLGRNPQELSDTVMPVLETESYYFTALGLNLEVANESGLGLADNGTQVAIITIPDDEIWAVKAITCDVTTTTSESNAYMFTTPTIDSINASPNQIGLTNSPDRGSGGNNVLGVANSAGTTAEFPNPLFLPGGVRIFSYVNTVVSSGTLVVTCDTRVLYYRLEK